LKKTTPYILGGLLIVAVIALFFSSRNEVSRVLDERISFRKKDKIPYGTFVAYENLERMFPHAEVLTRKQEPGYWDSVSIYAEKQAVIIISPQFNADVYELKNLIKFAEHGNHVFISTPDLPYEISDALQCRVSGGANLASYYARAIAEDTLSVDLIAPPFEKQTSFTYPGKQYDAYFSEIDTNIATVLGYDSQSRPDFIHLKAGQGNLYLHLAPMTFTNYFLMHKQNLAYYEKIMSLLPPNMVKIIWDEYYLNKRPKENDRKKNWLTSLLGAKNAAGKKPFAAAFWLLLSLLLIYVLVEMRRKQRYIPVIKRPRNDSLDFVKTVGRLYYDKGDHRNLARKMAAYFLEHVRARYKLSTASINEDFTKSLHQKTGIDESELAGIVYFIRDLDTTMSISDGQLHNFHKQLESFYKKA
jgi:hypothetical protein